MKNASTLYNGREMDAPPEYMNAFGAICGDRLFIHQFGNKTPISFERLKRVTLRKRRRYIRNILCFITAGGLIAFGYDLQLFGIAFYLMASVFIFTGIVNKEYDYKFMILHEGNFIELKVEKHFKDDAKIIAAKASKKINNKIK